MLFTIYGKDNCPHCVRAVETAKKHNLAFEYLKVGVHITREELIDLCSPVIPRTVPQIFLGDTRIGTCDDFVDYVETL